MVKNGRPLTAPEKGILVIAAVFLAFCAGWLLRGQLSGSITVETQRRLEPSAAVTAFPAPTETARKRVDVNRATAEELTAVPGIGEKLALAIVAERERGGPYARPEDLMRVSGIGSESVQKLLDYITVGE